ncbi:MAG: hypothetical protein J0G33_02365 [Afipia felis]|nr:hypothetical protein [Afipia felis]
MTMAGPPRETSRSRLSRSRLPHSLAIALWTTGSIWAVTVAAYLLGADMELIVPLMVFGMLTGVAEWMTRGRDK